MLTAVLLGFFSVGAAALAESPAMREVVWGNTTFAVDLYHRLAAEPGNLFVSPYSISMALGMTYGGARENTAAEMSKTMHFPARQELLHSAFKQLNQGLADTARETGLKLNIANGLCLTGGDVSAEYKALLRNAYQAELFDGGVDRINAWVLDRTEGKIDRLIDSLDPNSVCVLLNAIYFKGMWESQFKKDNTRNAPFTVAPDAELLVPFMYQKCQLQVIRKKGFQAASIPYVGKKMSMVILLPDDIAGLPALERQLSAEHLAHWLAELDAAPSRELRLFLPKYKMETSYDLAGQLRAMGMVDAFQADRADFTGMGWAKGELWIAQVKHKAFVEVNEQGTEATGATAVEMTAKSAISNLEFRADRPFLFLIRDHQTGAVLFMGRLANPAAA
jgi:serpin B